ncbi:MAG: hypothetical protein D6722_13205, partial [Bacteroidetes bacterium]
MKLPQSRLLRILATFSAWEIRHWQDFLASPYHNKHTGLQALGAKLVDHWPDWEGLEADDLARVIWGEAAYEERALRDLMARLTRLTESFVALRHWEKDPPQQDRDLLDGLVERGLWDLHQKTSRRSARRLAPPW